MILNCARRTKMGSDLESHIRLLGLLQRRLTVAALALISDAYPKTMILGDIPSVACWELCVNRASDFFVGFPLA